KYGGIVASSGKTSDFYQADEVWWQEAFDNGEGKVFVGEIEYNESSGLWAIPFAMPIEDENGKVLGICKILIDVKVFFNPVAQFHIGKTGHAFMFDENGNIMFHKGIEPFSEKILRMETFGNLLDSKEKWVVQKESHLHGKAMFITFAEVKHPVLLEAGIDWNVFIGQDAEEVFIPLRKLVVGGLITAFIMLVLLVPAGIFLGGFFSKPIRELQNAAREVSLGNLDCEIHIKTKDELQELAEIFNTMISDLKLNTTSIANLNKEIDNRKQAEQKISQAAKEWEETFNSISDAVSIQNKNCEYVKVNRKFLEIVNMEEKDVIGKKCFQIVQDANGPMKDDPCRRTLKTQKPYEIEGFDPRTNKYFYISTSPIFDENGVFSGIVHIMRDITGRKKMQLELEQAVETKSNFISVVSHELRTPLTIIKESVSVLFDEVTGKISEQQRKFLLIATRNIDRLARLINNVLDFQKLDSGKMQFNFVKANINETIEETAKSMTPFMKDKNLKLRIESDEKLPNVIFDKDKIIQVITNLMNNAVKFTEKGGITVSTSLETNGKNIKVSVKDTGQGIKEEEMHRLFQRFEQLEELESKRTGGTGLGLAISKEIIDAHKGKIWAESNWGKGSVFCFTLPV
ncbi:MAG: PAS domain-containing protein, partial [Candidatus Omnitrophica bacterium]|nr:PAS domain-containing protein [Candidatus Omnitrophota bacterium]